MEMLEDDFDDLMIDVQKITGKLISTTNKFFIEHRENDAFAALFTSCTLSYSMTVIDQLSDGFIDPDARDEYLTQIQDSFVRHIELLKNKGQGRCSAQH